MSVSEQVKSNGIRCPRCNDKLYSLHRHDFKSCQCGAVFVDGGPDYLRTGWDEAIGPAVVIDSEGNDVEVAK